jgi:peptide/nickel transport system permease protein
MTVIIILLIVLAVLVAWIVHVAGWDFAAKRLGNALLIIVLVTFATTLLLRQVGVDDAQRDKLEELGLPPTSYPCVSALGTGATEEAVLQCVDDRGLDEGVVRQYLNWVGDLLHGDLGYAYYKNQLPLSETIEQRAPRTAWLFLYSQMIALAIAVPLGIWWA